eukprot:scaffold383_cov317-Prasinococcus_capsulatus_cf.AAC.6
MKLPKELSLAWAFFPETGPFTIAQGGLFTFDYVGGHNVHQVPSMEDMEACNFENAVLVQGTGPAVLKMNEEGVFYYVCTVGAGNHCGTFSMQATIIVVCDIPAGSGDPNDVRHQELPAFFVWMDTGVACPDSQCLLAGARMVS